MKKISRTNLARDDEPTKLPAQPGFLQDIQDDTLDSASLEMATVEVGASAARVLDLPGFMRLEAVLEIVPVGRSKWYEGTKTGIYPKPVPLGIGRRRAYRRSDIKALVQRLDKGQG